MSVAVKARMDRYGMSREAAAKQESGTAIGRALRRGELNAGQASAAVIYGTVVANYQKAILARPLGSSSDLDRGPGYDGSSGDDPAYVDWCNAARRKYADSRRALLEADPLAQMAVNAWVLEDKGLDKQIGELRVGLNALAKLYGVGDWARAA